MNVLVAGAGYVGEALGRELVGRGHCVTALRRAPPADGGGLRWVAGDLTDLVGLRAILPGDLDVVVYAAAADARTPEAYERAYVRGVETLAEALAMRGIGVRRFLFTSSTAVYGQSEGEWVDELSETRPTATTARLLLDGERVVGALPHEGVVVRLGGIYGPGRVRLVREVAEGRARRPPAGRFSNRIHRDDCAGALAHLAELEKVAPIYVGVDRDPAPLRDVVAFLAAELGVPVPTEGDDADAERSSKRCRSDRLVGSGYVFRYPSFREGYRDIVRELASRG